MARWLILREGKGAEGTVVFYDNLVTGKRHTLGKLSSDVPDTMILEWIFKHGGPGYGDNICLSDGTQFVFQAREGACA